MSKYFVYQLAIVTWREKVVDKRVTDAVIQLIEQERDGKTMNTGIVKDAICCYFDDPTNPNSKLDFYRQYFETPFLDNTRRFYEARSKIFSYQAPLMTYIHSAEQILNDERERVTTYLHESTSKSLIKTCVTALLPDSLLSRIFTEFENCLRDLEGKKENLKRLYDVLTLRLEHEKLNKMYNLFETHVCAEGLEILKVLSTRGTNDIIFTYVTKILEVLKKYSDLNHLTFKSDTKIAQALDRACRKILNYNAFTENDASSSTQKSAEILARHCDSLLKTSDGNPEDQDLDDNLNKVVMLLPFLEDKDVFMKLCAKMLANRLMSFDTTGRDDDNELVLISKLKDTCDFGYACKLEQLYQDARSSKDLNQEFQEYVKEVGLCPTNFKVGLEVQLFSSMAWPFSHQSFEITLPPDLEQGISNFNQFYNTKFQGKKLNWLYSHCKGQLVTNCFDKRYTLQVSLLQMVILLMFNESGLLDVNELIEGTKLKKEVLEQVLKTLFKAGLLMCPYLQDDTGITFNTVIYLCKKFNSKKLRVNVNIPLKTETTREQTQTSQEIENERKFLIQATIVRVMKAKKILAHQQLMTEVLDDLSSRFTPSVQMIKNSIFILMDREYLKRHEEQQDVYCYCE